MLLSVHNNQVPDPQKRSMAIYQFHLINIFISSAAHLQRNVLHYCFELKFILDIKVFSVANATLETALSVHLFRSFILVYKAASKAVKRKKSLHVHQKTKAI